MVLVSPRTEFPWIPSRQQLWRFVQRSFYIPCLPSFAMPVLRTVDSRSVFLFHGNRACWHLFFTQGVVHLFPCPHISPSLSLSPLSLPLFSFRPLPSPFFLSTPSHLHPLSSSPSSRPSHSLLIQTSSAFLTRRPTCQQPASDPSPRVGEALCSRQVSSGQNPVGSAPRQRRRQHPSRPERMLGEVAEARAGVSVSVPDLSSCLRAAAREVEE